jgi:hypothetical protein
MAAIIPDYTRRWVNGTPYWSVTDEYTSEGTLIGVGTIEVQVFGRACGVAYASPVEIKVSESSVDDIFAEYFT